MKYIVISLITLLTATSLQAERLVRLYGVDRTAVMELVEEGYDVANFDARNGFADIMLPERYVQHAAAISESYEILPREWSQLLPENSRNAGYYYSVEENWDFWCSLAENYSDLSDTPVTIGQSYEGRDIYMIRMTSPLGGYKPAIYFSSLIHAREPGGNSVLIDFAMWLTSNYDGGDTMASFILDNATVYFVPVANPDGYIYNMPGGGMHRKNMNFTLGNGIDLNRNWGYMWGYDNYGSSGDPNAATYRGTAAFSEPETQVQRDFVIDIEPIAAMNYHTYGGYLLYPWGYEDIVTPDDALFQDWASAMTAENSYSYGTAWQVLYNVNGDQNDWSYCGEDVPKMFPMTPEVADNGFWGSQNDTTEIVRICNECRPMNILICMLALNYVGISDAGSISIGPGLSIDGVHPNPAASAVTFSVTSPASSAAEIVIYDTAGRAVHSVDANDPEGGTRSLGWSIPAGLPAGVYTARLTDGAGNSDSRMFTVLR